MTIEVQTSANGKPVTDVSDRKLYAGMIGRESYVFDIGSKCAASLSDANSLMVQDGSVLHNGAHTLLKGTTKFTIPSGLQEQRRSNIAVIRFSIDSKGALGADPIVLSGDPTTGDNPVDPEWIQDNLLDGATVSDMPLYRVVTDGVNALPPEPLFKQIQSAAAFRDSQSQWASESKESFFESIDIADAIKSCDVLTNGTYLQFRILLSYTVPTSEGERWGVGRIASAYRPKLDALIGSEYINGVARNNDGRIAVVATQSLAANTDILVCGGYCL